MPLTLDRPTSTVVHDVSWETYLRLREDAGRATRISYDNGRMEIMPPISMGHGRRTGLLAWLAEAYFESEGVDCEKIDVVTLQRQDQLRGCEGDRMYYVRAAPPPPGVDEIDLTIHEPPDLVIEVDLSSRSIDKEPIYAAFGVAELWRLDGDDLRLRVLRDDRSGYDDSPVSRLLPDLPVAELARHARLGMHLRQAEVVRRWRAVIGA